MSYNKGAVPPTVTPSLSIPVKETLLYVTDSANEYIRRIPLWKIPKNTVVESIKTRNPPNMLERWMNSPPLKQHKIDTSPLVVGRKRKQLSVESWLKGNNSPKRRKLSPTLPTHNYSILGGNKVAMVQVVHKAESKPQDINKPHHLVVDLEVTIHVAIQSSISKSEVGANCYECKNNRACDSDMSHIYPQELSLDPGFEEDFPSAGEIEEILQRGVRFPRMKGGKNRGLDTFVSTTANGRRVEVVQKVSPIVILSVNPNGIRTVPFGQNVEREAKFLKKDKGMLLSSICKDTKADILAWQEGHGYNLMSHRLWFKHKTFLCKLGQVGLVILNPNIVVVRSYSEENIVGVTFTLEGQTKNIISVYVPPHKADRRALATIKNLYTTLCNKEDCIVAGDFNCTLSDLPQDVTGRARKDLIRGLMAEVVTNYNLADADLVFPQIKPKMTHWNQELSNGSRIDRFYCSNALVPLIRKTGYINFSFGDHVMRSITIGPPCLPTPYRVKQTPALSDKALENGEVQGAIQKQWEKLDRILERIGKKGPIPTRKLYDLYEFHKAKALQEGMSAWNRIKFRKLKSKGLICKKIASLEKRQCIKGELSIKDRVILKDLKLALCIIEAKECRDKNIGSKIIAIQTEGKSNSTFFHAPSTKHRKIESISSTDDVDDKSERTNSNEEICALFEKKYTETYAKKVIDNNLLTGIIENLKFSLSKEQIESLSLEVTVEEVMAVMKECVPGVSPGKDHLKYGVFKYCPGVSAKFLATIANRLAKEGEAPPSFLTNEVVLLHKEEKVWHTGQFRPITLTNSDYKIIMNVWAKRLGPILNEIVGEHQKGFIPGRDGRENVIVVQACLDKLSKKLKGGVIFLDLEKAFDRVSHEALASLLSILRFPPQFTNTVKGIYSNSKVVIKVNDSRTKEIIVNSGTKQGCPISPLLFTIVAEVLTQQIVNDPEFKGVKISAMRKKVAAYADDTAIVCKDIKDLHIALKHLKAYETATGMKANKKKTEIVSNDFEILKEARALGFATPKETKYLGCPVGIAPNYDALWKKTIGKIQNAANFWKCRTAAIKDRVLLAKTMLLSKVWYFASILPVPPQIVDKIDKIIMDFVWNSSPHKVGRKQMRREKNQNGLDLWDLDAKIRALQAGWILKFVNNKITGSLFELIKEKCQEWGKESSLRHLLNDPDDNREFIGSAPLAEIIYSWSKIVKPEPKLTAGSWITEIVRTSNKRLVEEVPRGLFLVKRINQEDSTVVAITHSWSRGILTPGEAVSIRFESCCKITPPLKEGIPSPLMQAFVDPEEVQAIWHRGYNELGVGVEAALKNSITLTIREFGARFKRVEHNKTLYQAMKFANSTDGKFKKESKVKTNRFVEAGLVTDICKSGKHCWKSFAPSRDKSTLWLLINHALPVESRIRRDSITLCRRCEEGPEDLPHVFAHCPRAKEIYAETNTLLVDNLGIKKGISFIEAMNPGRQGTELSHKLMDTVNAIAVHNLWKDYCAFSHNNDSKDLPAKVISLEIVKDFALAVKAEIGLLRKDYKGWLLREKYTPGLLETPEVESIVEGLMIRTDILKSLLKGKLPPELRDLG
jgi:hypothetical protein